jgi:hypothetical protein
MSLQGPIVIVADESSVELAEAIEAHGGTKTVACTWAQAAATIRKKSPAAVVFNERATPGHEDAIAKIGPALDILQERYLPVLARVGADFGPAFPRALPISAKASAERIIAQLSSAQRVRTLEATVAQRAAAPKADGAWLVEAGQSDPLDEATVLVTGRGRSYPELCTAVGNRLAMIGSLSVESAARHLTSRPLDGIFIGPGFGPPTVNALLTALGEDARFRDLPIALIGGIPVTVDCSSMPNFERFEASPADVLTWMLPLIRLHAYEARLQRQLAAIEAGGLIDPQTELFTAEAFAAQFRRVVDDTRTDQQALSLARFCFPAATERRIILEVARQASRVIRSVDFASLATDGSILLAFPNTQLRNAHVVARRIAGALKNTVITAATPDGQIETSVSLATLTATDTSDTLLARVFETESIAAAAE